MQILIGLREHRGNATKLAATYDAVAAMDAQK